jgi:hypothetical protein
MCSIVLIGLGCKEFHALFMGFHIFRVNIIRGSMITHVASDPEWHSRNINNFIVVVAFHRVLWLFLGWGS